MVGIFYCKYVTMIFLQRILENGNGLFKFSAEAARDLKVLLGHLSSQDIKSLLPELKCVEVHPCL